MPKWNGGVIGVANNPTQSSAKGIWSLSEATKAIRAGLWPPSNAGADPYFENVTLLLPGDGTNGAQNNTFLDSSTNNFTITRNGNTTQGTFTPFSKVDGRWSNYFDGTGDYLNIASNSAFAVGSAFTIEFWLYPSAYGANPVFIFLDESSGGLQFGLNSGNLGVAAAGVGWRLTGSSGPTLNTWNHCVLVRSGTGSNQTSIFLNGTRIANGTVTDAWTTTVAAYIQSSQGTSYLTTGYMSNVRIVKGTAVYDPSQSTLTVPTGPLTAISGTSLLTCQSNRFIDNSTNAFAITRNGDVSVQTFSPFPTLTAYAAGTNGGSGYFDGSGDYLSVARNSAFLPTGDFTYELWVYPTATPDATNGAWLGGLGESGDGSNFSWVFKILSDFTISFYIRSTNVDRLTTAKVVPFQWNYVVVTRQGSGSNNLLISVNGANQTYTDTGSLVGNGSPQFTIGADQNGDEALVTGYISSARFLNGTGYTSVTIPTAPPTAITNTSLLTNFTNGGIIDTSMSNDLETVGNAQISTTQSKFGGASMYFDGTGDSLDINNTQLGIFSSGDFTIECWVYFNALPGSASSSQIIDFRGFGVGTNVAPCLSLNNTSGTYNIRFESGSSNIADRSVSVSTGTWYHLAAVRSSGNVSIYWNGTISGTAFSLTTNYSTGYPVRIGAYTSSVSVLNGYIDDLRITKGVARYTSNFTAPVAPFNGFGD